MNVPQIHLKLFSLSTTASNSVGSLYVYFLTRWLLKHLFIYCSNSRIHSPKFLSAATIINLLFFSYCSQQFNLCFIQVSYVWSFLECLSSCFFEFVKCFFYFPWWFFQLQVFFSYIQFWVVRSFLIIVRELYKLYLHQTSQSVEINGCFIFLLAALISQIPGQVNTQYISNYSFDIASSLQQMLCTLRLFGRLGRLSGFTSDVRRTVLPFSELVFQKIGFSIQ